MQFYNSLVYFEWDDYLDGRIGYMANLAADLRERVGDIPSGDYGGVSVGRVHHSPKRGHPFLLGDTSMSFRFFYPLLFADIWEAYQGGARVSYHTGDSNWRVVPPGTIITDQTYWSNDYTYKVGDESPCKIPSLIFGVTSADESDSVTCTWSQLAEWLASGFGLMCSTDMVMSNTVHFKYENRDEPVPSTILVRPFGKDYWVSPFKDRICSDLGIG